MAKKDLPCGHPRSAAMYFGNAMGCTTCSRKWKWIPAQWHEVIPRKEGETSLESLDETSNESLASAPKRSILERIAGK